MTEVVTTCPGPGVVQTLADPGKGRGQGLCWGRLAEDCRESSFHVLPLEQEVALPL